MKPPRAVAPSWTDADYDFVKECWDNVRHGALYEVYFGEILHRVQNLNLGMEIVVAATASGSAVSSWVLWQEPAGKWLWGGLLGIAALISIVKPFIRLDLKIEKYSKLLSEYRSLSLSYKALIFNIQQAGDIRGADHAEQAKLAERIKKAREGWPAQMSDSRSDEIQKRIAAEYPANKLWAPKVPGKHPGVPMPDPIVVTSPHDADPSDG